ncbi:MULTISPECIES: glycosyltransferase family 4 protein [unclassified Rhizobium]|uniref:glycosyltransferase family 4 protein n=1 Tax=unclassified Rhizobium TaxID=2613769 RepID=UPI00177F7DD6|nr:MULTISPECIES: glycosyltransferase family 4 protein [unclassified Rhizobium]MBD8688155.1 glycosyltransferase family 4 protein [Rhizobium sp. CFBP 13644]MBD8692610.1 glycosyltransferase family 4 protein [Rhizobium sp. CFBP 13717]
MNRPENSSTSVHEPMCVCVVGLRGIPNVMGGVETHCEELYPRLKQILGDKIRVKILARRGYVSAPSIYKGVEVVPIYSPANKYLETIVHTALAIIHAKFRHKANAVHIHAIGPALMAPLARLLGMKVVVTHHGEDYRRAKWNWFAKTMLMKGEAMAVRFASKLIVITHNIKDRLKSEYGIKGQRISYVPNGVSIGGDVSVDESILEEFGLGRGEYVLGVARLVPEKGFQDLVKAWANGRGRNRARKLVIAGDADHQDKFALELLSHASEDIIFTGRQPRSKVLALFKSASLFVLPSYHEGLPFVALEAIACGAPIALSDIPGNRELGLAEHAYFRPGDMEAITARLSDDPKTYEADKRILDNYSWEFIASRTAALYADLLSMEPPPAIYATTAANP